MRTIKLEASDGEVLRGELPEHWGEVPLLPYARLAIAAEPVAESLLPTVHMFYNEPAIVALAALVGLPADILLADRSLIFHIFQAAPWLFVGPLPEGTDAAPTLKHLGKTYQHVGDLDGSRGWQMEALLTLLKTEGNPLAIGPALLAILYCTSTQPHGSEIQAAARAFESLPMSQAYPALVNFLRRSVPRASPIQRYLVAQPQAEQAVSALETMVASPSSGPRASSWNMPHWLLARLIRRVRKQLATSSPPSAFTAGRPS